MKFENHVTLAARRSKVCSVWGLGEICFSLRRNLALSVLATGFTSKFLFNNHIKVNLCQTSNVYLDLRF